MLSSRSVAGHRTTAVYAASACAEHLRGITLMRMAQHPCACTACWLSLPLQLLLLLLLRLRCLPLAVSDPHSDMSYCVYVRCECTSQPQLHQRLAALPGGE